MKEWFLQLSRREKQSLLFGSILLSIFIGYAFILAPLNKHVISLRQQVKQEEKLLAYMQSADQVVRNVAQAKGRTKPASPVALLSILQKKIGQAGLASNLAQLKQGANDTVVLRFQNIAFDKFVSLWIEILQQQNISIAQMRAKALKSQGLVDVEMSVGLA